jgi:glycine betaine/choline ABC-type transport system substrate-binding protein
MRRRTALLAPVLALAVASCGSSGSPATNEHAAARPGAGRPPIVLGTKISPVSLLLGQLYAQTLRSQGFTVELRANPGTTADVVRALRAGRVGVAPVTIESFDAALGVRTAQLDSATAALVAGRTAARRQGLALLAPTQFAQAAALAVLPALAHEHQLRDVADLARIRPLRLGATPDFRTHPGGLPGLLRTYPLSDVRYYPFTIPVQYQVLDAGKIDVAAVATTDGQLANGDYVLLRDSRHFFGFQQLVPIVPARVLEAEGPAFARAIDAVSRVLTPARMQELDAEVAIDKRSPEEVARDFLDAHPLPG